MKIFYPHFFKATFSKDKFKLSMLEKCINKYAYSMNTLVYSKQKTHNYAYVHINEWKQTKESIQLIEHLNEYKNVNVLHNEKGHYWTFSPIFSGEYTNVELKTYQIVEFSV